MEIAELGTQRHLALIRMLSDSFVGEMERDKGREWRGMIHFGECRLEIRQGRGLDVCIREEIMCGNV